MAKLNGDVPLLEYDFDGGLDVFHNAIGMPSDGLMAVGVGTFGGAQEGVIVRFNSKGQYVNSFGQNGLMRFKIGALSTQMTGIKRDDFGRYLFTGFYQDTNSSAAKKRRASTGA